MRTKIAAISALLVIAANAHADIIKCSFTEPFITVTYSTNTSELTTSSFAGEGEDVSVEKAVSFQIKGPGKFELVSAKGETRMKLDLNFAGSDGMSDFDYPYHAELTTSGFIGGCSSNHLHVKKNGG